MFHFFGIKLYYITYYMMKTLDPIIAYIMAQYYSIINLAQNIFVYRDIIEIYMKMLKLKNVCLLKTKDSCELYSGRCIYFCNHRSAADLFIDGYLTNCATYISLLKSLYLVPFATLAALYHKCIILFSYNFSSRKHLYQRAFDTLKYNSLIVYPEGTRNIQQKSLKLKHGFTKFAWVNNIPIQIIITTKKEDVLSFKLWKADNNVECTTTISDVLFPWNFGLAEWINKVEDEWATQWSKVY